MSKMENIALMYGMSAIMADGQFTSESKRQVRTIDFTPKQPPIPKGCKEYFFNERGVFSNVQMLKSECVFKCIAATDTSAKKKFNNWKLK